MEKELLDAGLSENEIKTYLTLLKEGALSSYELSKKTSLNRGYLYELLKKLHAKGIITERTEDGKHTYAAVDPQQLVVGMEFRIDNLKSVIPHLQKLRHFSKGGTKIEVYRGELCYRNLLKDVIATVSPHSSVYIFGINENKVMDLEPIYLKRYLALCKQKKVKEKAIISVGSTKLPEAKTTTYREIPDKYIGKIPYFVYENKVALLTLSEPMNIIIIEDAAIADTYRVQFGVFWKIAK